MVGLPAILSGNNSRLNTGVVAVCAITTLGAAAAMYAYCKRQSHIAERAVKLRLEERTGRLRAEKALAALRSNASTSSGNKSADAGVSYALPQIAVIRSPFSGRNGTPRQPALVPSAIARIELASEVPESALEGIDEFSHVWVRSFFVAHNLIACGY